VGSPKVTPLGKKKKKNQKVTHEERDRSGGTGKTKNQGKGELKGGAKHEQENGLKKKSCKNIWGIS